MHKKHPDFGTSAIRHWSGEVRLFATTYLRTNPNYTLMDYGCGKNDFAVELGVPVQRYDPGIKEFSVKPDPADLVLCIDVLEHIEPNHISEVLTHLADMTRVAGFFVISVRKAGHVLPDGRNAHILIRSQAWWETLLDGYFDSVTVVKVKENDHFACIVTKEQTDDRRDDETDGEDA